MPARLLALALLAFVALPGAASADRRPADRSAPDFDVRTAGAQAASRSGSARTPAQRRLVGTVGSGGTLDVDRVTGTVRSLNRVTGTLTGASKAAPATIVVGYARAHAAALGLSAADVDRLGAARVVRAPGGLTTVRFTQAAHGIPAYDSELRGAVDRDGRLLMLAGAPAAGLKLNSATPAIGAAAAHRALARSVGATGLPAVISVGTGVRHRTAFANGDMGRLVAFVTAKGARLAWHVTLQAREGTWSGVVDARTGRLLRRQDLVDHATTTRYYPRYPGFDGPDGNTTPDAPLTIDLAAQGYLDDAAGLLDGPFSRAYSDVNADDGPNTREEVRRTAAGNFIYGLTTFPGNDEDSSAFPGQCPAATPCTWNDLDPTSWRTNRAQATLQSFVYVNLFHDHLAAAPIGFDDASGAFAVIDPDDPDAPNDPILTESDDGAATDADGGPLADFLNNANMATLPDGQSPRMQMYLGSIHDERFPGLFRNNNNGEDAATVYHEYAHGLSNRLITTADGVGAVSSAQAGAMGEAWSDWYAFDYLNAANLAPDTAAPGEIDLGDFTDYLANSVRTQPLDCPVLDGGPGDADIEAACPGTADYIEGGPGPGGYTYGDLGTVYGGPEPHGDGEIWGETLWDLRTALGSTTAEALVTGGMRLSIPEPSFLDMRNAILIADQALNGGADQDVIWSVFANRGMGYFAGSVDGSDTAPIEDFSVPPAPDAPKGTVAGRITDQDTGAPVPGVSVGVGGLNTPGLPGGALGATTGDDGAYSFTAPVHTYSRITAIKGGGYFPATVADVPVTAGTTAVRDLTIRRTIAFGAPVETNNDSGGAYGCGIGGLDDASQGSVWEIDRIAGLPEPPVATIDLGSVQSIAAYGLDPSQGCGSGPGSATKGYVLESSTDGVDFTVVSEGEFAPEDAGTLNEIAAPDGAQAARYVRLTLLSPQDEGTPYWDFAELAVFGGGEPVVTPTETPTAEPTTEPEPEPTPDPRPAVSRPRIVLLAPTRGRARVRVRCATGCALSASASVSRTAQRKARLKRARLVLVRRAVRGEKVIGLQLPKAARAKLRRRVGKRVTVTVRVSATSDTDGLKASKQARVRLRL